MSLVHTVRERLLSGQWWTACQMDGGRLTSDGRGMLEKTDDPVNCLGCMSATDPYYHSRYGTFAARDIREQDIRERDTQGEGSDEL